MQTRVKCQSVDLVGLINLVSITILDGAFGREVNDDRYEFWDRNRNGKLLEAVWTSQQSNKIAQSCVGRLW